MAKFIRYTLAAVCFAASVGCLALWWRSHGRQDSLIVPSWNQTTLVFLRSRLGTGSIGTVQLQIRVPSLEWKHSAGAIEDKDRQYRGKRFLAYRSGVRFPLWYPALIFALAGVGVLRFRRQFSIRSALVAVSVVAALLGVAVTM